jgi:hypothetical protein
MRPPVTPRVLLLLVAVAMVAWLAAGLVASDGLQQAGEVVVRAQGRPLSAEELQKGRDGLDRARRLANDSASLNAEIGLLIVAGRREEALRVAEDVVRREPENFEGWRAVYGLTVGSDPERAAVARRRALELNPLAGGRLPRSPDGS